MRASMRANGTTFRPRRTSDPAGTEDPDGRERPGGVPHKDEVVVETTTDENYLCRLGGTELLNDFVGQREWKKHVH